MVRTILPALIFFCLPAGKSSASAPRYEFAPGEKFSIRLRTRLRVERIGVADRVEMRIDEQAAWRLDHRVSESLAGGAVRMEVTVAELTHDTFSVSGDDRVRARFDSTQPAGHRFNVNFVDEDGDVIERVQDASAHRPPPQSRLLERRWSFVLDPAGGAREVRSMNDTPGRPPRVLSGRGKVTAKRLAAQLAALWPALPSTLPDESKPVTVHQKEDLPLLGMVAVTRTTARATSDATRLELRVAVSAETGAIDTPLALLLPGRRSTAKMIDVRTQTDRFRVQLERHGTPENGTSDRIVFQRGDDDARWRLQRVVSRRETAMRVQLDDVETRRRVRTEVQATRLR